MAVEEKRLTAVDTRVPDNTQGLDHMVSGALG